MLIINKKNHKDNIKTKHEGGREEKYVTHWLKKKIQTFLKMFYLSGSLGIHRTFVNNGFIFKFTTLYEIPCSEKTHTKTRKEH